LKNACENLDTIRALYVVSFLLVVEQEVIVATITTTLLILTHF